jgi:hypothetical protein
MPRKSSASSAYPRRGTQKGDEPVGACQGPCRAALRRGDAFVVTLEPKLICRKCWAQS